MVTSTTHTLGLACCCTLRSLCILPPPVPLVAALWAPHSQSQSCPLDGDGPGTSGLHGTFPTRQRMAVDRHSIHPSEKQAIRPPASYAEAVVKGTRRIPGGSVASDKRGPTAAPGRVNPYAVPRVYGNK